MALLEEVQVVLDQVPVGVVAVVVVAVAGVAALQGVVVEPQGEVAELPEGVEVEAAEAAEAVEGGQHTNAQKAHVVVIMSVAQMRTGTNVGLVLVGLAQMGLTLQELHAAVAQANKHPLGQIVRVFSLGSKVKEERYVILRRKVEASHVLHDSG